MRVGWGMTEFLLTAASVIMGVVAADSAAPHLPRLARAFQDAFARWSGR
jgi:hypothetical protein